MLSKRYSIIVSDPLTGREHRVTLPLRPVLAAGCVLLTLPVLVGIGAAWKAKADVADALSRRDALEAENANYRAATEALAGQIGALQSAIADLGARSALDPGLARAMDKLPALVKARAMGGALAPKSTRLPSTRLLSRWPTPTTRSACCARCSKASNRASAPCSGASTAATRWPPRRRRSGRRTAG